MKRTQRVMCLILALAMAACSNQKETAEIVKPAQYTIEQFMDIENINGGSFSADESKILINSQISGIFNAYEIDIATGERTQLTNSSDNAIFARSYMPNGEIIYTSDKGGDEITHIYVRKTDGDIIDMISDSTAKASFYGWNNEKTILYYGSNQRDPKYFDLYKVDIENSSTEDGVFSSSVIYTNSKGLNPSAISNNSRYVVLSETITTNNSNMYLYDSESGETKLISEHEGDVQYSPQYFSLDDSKLYYLTDEGNEFMYIKSYDMESGEISEVQKENWDIMYTYLSKTGKYRVVGINNDARTEIKIYDANDQPIQMANMPEGDITGVNISDSEQQMAFYVSSSKSPRNLYLYNFETQEVKQITDTMNPEINPDDLVAGEVIRYKSFDGMEIPALLYKPKGLEPGEKVPAMLMIHGGPGGQTRLNYTPRLQYFLNHGYAILAVNNRGSSGYGKTFYAADDQRHGQDDLQDCVESKKFLASLDYIDADKIGIMGGSYGGYMVMAALTFAPEEFALGVNYFGVTNWLRTLKSIPPWWASFREALYKEMGDPVADSIMLYNKSPLFHTDKITKPFIVLQGSNDPRVLKVESDEIVEGARKNGVEVEYVLFDDEGHGFVKKENNITASKEVLKFLDKHFKTEKAEEAI
ncbi:S9 family peptidase [Fulvivirga lutimaris]|uniref:S9 family peptidase n=1 Tax=Fulvivirga lutimaris TaxID=1819566 RepID=UPI0016253820|nr:S9 family peptidase [Fulvivirga lutimaris]